MILAACGESGTKVPAPDRCVRDQLGRRSGLSRSLNRTAAERNTSRRAVRSAPRKRVRVWRQVAAWSVGNPADSASRPTRAQSNPPPGRSAAPWSSSCCSSRMDRDALRARVRKIIASGKIPPGPDGALVGRAARITRIVIGRSLPEPCSICGEAGSTRFYIYSNQSVVRVHGACEVLWREEGEAPS